MKVISIELNNFRNIKNLKINPSSKVNVIYGTNAQGKTNLIEAIWICTGLKNFRNSSFNQWTNFDSDYFNINMDYKTSRRSNNIKIKYQKIKSETNVLKNGVRLNSIPLLAGGFLGVVFSPDHLDLVSGSPEERRNFLNYAIGQLKPHYIDLVSKYEKTLFQRNSILRDVKYSSDKLMLQVWDESLAGFGASIIEYRHKYISDLKKHAREFYQGISSDKEKLTTQYSCNIAFDKEKLDIKEINKNYEKALKDSLNNDLKLGYTTAGIHRDDLILKLDNKNVRYYGSQGQKRSVVISLKLAESKIIEIVTKHSPVIFLDDVLSELDQKRQDYILNNLGERQVFITSCDKNLRDYVKTDKVFRIVDGRIEDE